MLFGSPARVRARGEPYFQSLGVGSVRALARTMTKSQTDASPFQMLIAARDEVRLKVHLLGMESKKHWDELEAKIFSLEARLGQGAEKMTEATAVSALELADSVKQFMDAHLRKAHA
jgi:hypothetical protein